MHSNGGETVTWASPVRAFLMRHPRILGTMLNAWGVLIGSLAVFACVVFFIDPESTIDRSSLSFQLGGWANVWNILYGVGGLLMVYGIVRPDRAADVAGLFLFGGATLINFTSIALTLGPRSLIVAPHLIGFCLAALARAVVIIVIAETRDGPELPPP
jgi:hypothetical protein